MTQSRHQGNIDFPENGSWSWFEISILKCNGYPKERNGKPLTWRSHENSVDSTRLSRYIQHFDTHHEIWRELRDGDSLGVFGCARQPGWMCVGREAKLVLHLFDGNYVD